MPRKPVDQRATDDAIGPALPPAALPLLVEALRGWGAWLDPAEVVVPAAGTPEHVADSLRSRVGAEPPAHAVATSAIAEAAARRRCRVGGLADRPDAERSTELLLEILGQHWRVDLGIPGGRVEAWLRVLGYVLWFQAKHGRGGSAGLTAATVRSCLGNHYIRTHARPDLTWIHYGLQAAAAYGAFLRARAWAPPEVVAGLLALPRDAGWFRLRLAEYWRLEGDGFRSWVLERDYTAL